MSASSYVSVTCPDGVDYSRDIDGSTFDLSEKVSLGSALVPSSEESFTIINNTTSIIRRVQESVERLAISVYSRIGDLVLVTYVTGLTSASFASDYDFYSPSVEFVNASTESIVKSLLPRIGIRPRLNTPTITTTTN
jgi:hypothetical protein